MELLSYPLTFWCFFVVVVVVVPQPTLAGGSYLAAVYLNCLHNTTDAKSLTSTFKHNLNTTLQNLTSLSSQGTKYAIASAGSGGDIVYAMFQCRGDQTTPLCSECVASATVRLPQRDCPSSIGARIQLDGCYFRYDNTSFFTPDFSYVSGLCSAANTSDPVVLEAIWSLVQNVTTQAPEQGGFSSASAAGEYAAAQCLGYLNKSECAECLSSVPYRTVCDSTLGEQVHLNSCYYRFESYPFLVAHASAPAPHAAALAPAPAPSSTHTGSKNPKIIAGISVSSIIALVVLCVTLVWCYKAIKKPGEEAIKPMERETSWSQSHVVRTKAKVFSLQELEKATMEFHPNNKLGEGGYGCVYKGTLSNGEQVAVKKLFVRSHQGLEEFLNEVGLITSVQHKNLIRLLGSCVEGSERILVYEYLPNKSLDSILFEEQEDGKTLDWPTRYRIILGMAKGLAYLHEESHTRIIHRDIKPSNILLDNQLNPVIADFGLARLVKDDETHITTRVAGTIGYVAPEYAMYGELSEKTDVFSFGLVSLEILSGKKTSNNRILEQAWRLYTQKEMLDLIDKKLGNTAFSPEQVIRVAHVALLCTQENPKQRPKMSTVTLLLSGKSDILEIPNKPAFVDLSQVGGLEGITNSQWSSMPSSSGTTHTQNSTQTLSHAMSNAVYSISDIVDPR